MKTVDALACAGCHVLLTSRSVHADVRLCSRAGQQLKHLLLMHADLLRLAIVSQRMSEMQAQRFACTKSQSRGYLAPLRTSHCLQGKVSVMQLDLADLDSVHALTKELLSQHQRLDYIILNAGGTHTGRIDDPLSDEKSNARCHNPPACRGDGMPARQDQARL